MTIRRKVIPLYRRPEFCPISCAKVARAVERTAAGDMVKLRIVAAALGSLALAACAGDAGLSSGPASGGGSSAFTGSVPPTSGNPLPATGPAGTTAPLTAALDPRDRSAAGAAHLRALQFGEPGAPVSWRNPETGHRGTIVPGPAYQSNGQTCREFSHTVYAGERPQTGRGASCRNPDGTWTPLS
jgi:surface antigen